MGRGAEAPPLGGRKPRSGKSRCKTTPTAASVGPPTVVHVPMPDHLDSTIVANLDASGQIASVREGSLGGGGGGAISSTAVGYDEMQASKI